MSGVNWKRVYDNDFRVPQDAPLSDLTAELTRLLGDTDPTRRDDLAWPVLATWIGRGVYDDLLLGLGDGMAAGLRAGVGEQDTDSVFRRSFSSLVLAECLSRDNQRGLLTPEQILSWGDHLATWLLTEKDVRGFVPDKGWAHAVAHGADAVGVLAASAHVEAAELTVLLDVLGERAGLAVDEPFTCGEQDRLAAATLAVLRRDLVPFDIVEAWVEGLVDAHSTATRDLAPRPSPTAANIDAYARSLYLQLGVGYRPPRIRADLLLALVDALRRMNPSILGAPPERS